MGSRQHAQSDIKNWTQMERRGVMSAACLRLLQLMRKKKENII